MLMQQGFSEDTRDGAPVCRWLSEGVVLDVMPTDPQLLGFGNRWYRPAIDAAIRVELPSGSMIRTASAPHFIATKLEAFAGRGGGDYLLSHDLEDLIAVVDGRAELVAEVAAADGLLRNFLGESIAALIDDRRFIDAIAGFLPPDPVSQRRVSLLVHRLRQIAGHA